MGDTEGGGGCVWGGISDLLSATLGLGQGVGGGRSGCSIRPYSGCGWRGAGCRVQGADLGLGHRDREVGLERLERIGTQHAKLVDAKGGIRGGVREGVGVRGVGQAGGSGSGAGRATLGSRLEAG